MSLERESPQRKFCNRWRIGKGRRKKEERILNQRKKWETDVGGEKENVSKNDKTVGREETAKGINTRKEKVKSTKRKATANVAEEAEERQTKKGKKAKSYEADAKIKASKEATLKFFTDNDSEPEVTEVDVQ